MKPGSAVAHNELGVSLFQQDAVEVSVKSFQKALTLDPKLKHGLANLGEAFRRAKQYKKGATAYHRFLQVSKRDPYGLFGLGLCFEGYHQLGKSLKTLDIAAKASTDFRPLLGRIRRAIKRVQFKIKEAKLPLLQRVDAMILAGKLAEAEGLIERGLNSKKKSPALNGRRGLVKAIQGDYAAAQTHLETALLGDPTDQVAAGTYVMVMGVVVKEQVAGMNAARAGALLGTDRAALAYKAYNIAISVKGAAPALHYGRGEASARMALFDDAADDFKSAGKLPEAQAALAEIHFIQGDSAAANKHWEAAKLRVPLADLPVWRRSLLQQ
jgi:tetratricopeptide (TPR) repeat protein